MNVNTITFIFLSITYGVESSIPTYISEAPFVVQIERWPNANNTGKIALGVGAIINYKWAVTVKHIVTDETTFRTYPSHELRVRSGSGQLGLNGGVHYVHHVTYPDNSEEYDINFGDYDIVLLKLSLHFNPSRTVQIARWKPVKPLNVDDTVIIFGWQNDKNNSQISEFVGLLVDPEKCNYAFYKKMGSILSQKIFCVQTQDFTSNKGLGGNTLIRAKTNGFYGLMLANIDGNLIVFSKLPDYETWLRNTIIQQIHYQ